MNLLQLTPAELRKAAALKERIEGLQRELESVLGTSATATASKKVHWTQTPAGRARLKKSARMAWHTRRGSTSPKLHWTQTPAGKAKMAKIRAKRWQNR